LSQKKALLVIDNVETFPEVERDRLYQFLDRLPASCKAMVTSRRRANIFAQVIRLDKISAEESTQLLNELTKNLPRLQSTSPKERTDLYEAAGGNPLLLTWLAGQLGRPRSECRDVPTAIAFLKAAPANNDPLEYIFGDLVEAFTENEMGALAALTLFTQPAKTKWVAETADLTEPAAQAALEDLTDCALVVADENFAKFFLPRLAAEFLRRRKPQVIARAGENLTDQVFALVQENGYKEFERFPNRESEWERVAAALPLFVQGENRRLQTLCNALIDFMEFTGRWDEWLDLGQQTEAKAVAAQDFDRAGWRAYQTGWVYSLRGQSAEVLNCADRATAHWERAKAGVRERATVISLRGVGHKLAKDYAAAITAYRETLALWRTLTPESKDVAIALNEIADTERLSDDYDAAERDYAEAVRIAKKVSDSEGVVIYTGNLAGLALDRQQWAKAEGLAREALTLAKKVGRLELIAKDCAYLAKALARQDQPAAGLSYAQRAVEIYTRLRVPELEDAQEILAECEAGAARA
jgi:tetratricopeptide (TPR) repeat protein